MRKFFSVLFLLCYLFSFVAPAQEKTRPKIGVVLSGGGSKGFAHIGALKVMEEAGIPIDYIAGTSMGSIIGGLYAIGYNAAQLDSVIKMQDWTYLLSDNIYRSNMPWRQKENLAGYLISLPYKFGLREDSRKVQLPSGVIGGQNLYNLFQNLTIGYHDHTDFTRLPIPFGCVAADSRSGKEVDFLDGVLPQAMRASMAIPGVFSPVEMDSMLLIDGGIINNYPVDLVKKMGADVVIGVIIPHREERAIERSRGSMMEVMEEIGEFVGTAKRSENIKNTDVLIRPELFPYGGMEFQRPAIDSVIVRGEIAARKQWHALMELKDKLNITDNEPVHKISNPFIALDTLQISEIEIHGVDEIDEEKLLKQIKAKKTYTRMELDNMVEKFYGTGLFNSVYYQLDGVSPFKLKFHVVEKDLKTLNLGLRFDTRDMAAILANSKFRLNKRLNSVFEVTTRLSQNPYLQLDYSINRSMLYRRSLILKLSRNEVKVFDRGKLAYNLGFTRSSLDINFSEFYFYNIKLHLGVNMEYVHYFSELLSDPGFQNLGLQNKPYVNYFINAGYDDLDKSYFPTRGQYFSFQYTLSTDNFAQMDGGLPLQIANARFLKPIRMADRVVVIPQIAGRAIFNDSIPLIYKNFVGGNFDGHYVPQQIALPGSRGMEILKNMAVQTGVDVRLSLTPNQFVQGNLNFTLHDDKLFKSPQVEYFFGGSIGYSYNTVAGPLTFEVGYSGRSKLVSSFASFGYYF